MIPHSRPFIGAEEVEAAAEAVESGYLSSGAQVTTLEKELADFLGVKGAVACSSGTAALYLALRAVGAGSDTTVHIPSFVCTALWNAAGFLNTQISVCDVDPIIGNISCPDVLKRRRKADDIVILPHMFGAPGPIIELKEAGFKIIEDCAQAIGALCNGKLVGTFGDAAIFSFFATKVLCAGEGGALASDSVEILALARDICDYDHKNDLKLRFNFKMTEMQAALARIQLKRLPDFIRRRQKIAAKFDQAVMNSRFQRIERSPSDIYFRYILKTNDLTGTIARFKHHQITAALPVFFPIHRYLKLDGYLITDQLYRTMLSIPCYPALTDEETETICAAIIHLGSNRSALSG